MFGVSDVFKTQTVHSVPNLRVILGTPVLANRCFELTNYLKACCLEDLNQSFQPIVDSIFGRNGFPGWGLKFMTRQGNQRDSDALLKFLSPNGPLITAAYKLLEFPLRRFEVPLKDLPKRIERQITSGLSTPFYTSKIHMVADKYFPVNYASGLSMNPFEYYFLHFALLYLGASDSCNYLIGWGVLTDSVYSLLVEEYLAYFFPCDGGGVQSVEQCVSLFTQNNICQTPNIQKSNLNMTSFDRTLSYTQRPQLFKETMFKDQLNAQREMPFTGSSNANVHREIWRSEAILSTFIEIYLSFGCENSENIPDMDTVLPTVDLVKVVRLIVRHLHYFHNCVHKTALHPMEELRRKLIPIYQKKLYFFIRFSFNRWPLDNSFRIVYETWLSYIQPWRYTDFAKINGYKSKERDEVPIDDQFYTFIMENILFYTVLFKTILPRFLRSDLSTNKGALMVYRVIKVFGFNESLQSKLMEIERSLKSELNSSPPSHFMHHFGTNFGPPTTSYADPSYPPGIKFGNVKQMLKELEPQETYKPLFFEETKETVMEVMKHLLMSKRILNSRMAIEEEEALVEASAPWYSKIFKGLWFEATTGDPQKKIENDKTLSYIEGAFAYFASFFCIDPSEVTEDTFSFAEAPFSDCLTSDRSERSESFALSPKILRPGTLTPKVEPMGNPDIILIRADEYKIIVRLAYIISQFINDRFGSWMEKIYFDNNWKGKFARSILARPCFYEELVKPLSGHQTRKRFYLPPRVSLRFLGSSGALFTLAVIGILFFFFEVGSVSLMLFYVALLFMCYIGLRAYLEPPRLLQSLRLNFFGNQGPRNRKHSTPKPSTPRQKNRFTL